jgi:hypothetical protein
LITVVCIFNNIDKLNNCLVKSLDKQNVEFEKIFIDNTDNKYNSAASVFNRVWSKAKGEFIMFVHQDVELLSNNWLDVVEKEIKRYKDIGVVGVAGCKQNTKGVYTNAVHGIQPEYAGQYRIDKTMEAQTVDECLFIVPKQILESVKFDENICNGWHLYSVDYCLSVLKNKYKVYLIPNEIYHYSSGFSMDSSYFKILLKLVYKNKKHFTNIRTTCGNWDTKNNIKILNLLMKSLVKKYLKNIMNTNDK